jgi:hypothetical protein
MKHVVKLGLPLVLLLAAASSRAQSLEVLGYAGVLGEWELTASVAGTDARSYAGPLRMRHVGICTQDGPEERTGSIRLQLSQVMQSSRLPPQMSAKLRVDGVTCTYSGRLTDSYAGTMECPDRASVPLKIWLK